MDKENCVVSRAAGIATPARPRPPSLGGWTDNGMTARILPDHDRLCVLIADNDADTTDSLALLVQLWGYEVWVAHTGAEALAMAFRFQPDVLLLDVAMPDVDGFAVARAIRQQPSLDGVLLVAVTGFADDAHRQLGKRAGFDHYLVKPVEPSVIQTLLLRTADSRSATQTTSAVQAGRAIAARCLAYHADR